MEAAEKRVRAFLENLQTYLYGDLDTFNRLCEDSERLNGGLSGTAGNQGTSSFAPHPDSVKEPVSNPPTTYTGIGAGTTGISGYDSLSTNFFPYGKTPFTCTIPHTLAVLAAMDILGYLIGELDNAGDTGENIKLFLKEKVTDIEELNCLIFISRHGMSHSFFPKKEVSIKVNSKNPKNDLFFVDTNDSITLNVNYLIEILKSKFDQIMGLDENAFLKMEKQLEKLEKKDDIKLKDPNYIYKLDLGSFKLKLKKVS